MRVLLLALLALPNALLAQPTTATLTGIVRDFTGEVIPGVQVTLTNTATSHERVLKTGATGLYHVPGLQPGTYSVRIEHPGFRPATLPSMRLTAGATTALDTALQLEGVQEIIHIPSVISRADTGGLGHLVDAPTIAALPLNGRNFISLASLAPGVALPPGSTLPRINGGRPRTNEYLIDGISVLQPEPGQVAFFPILDAIEALTIESNSPPAEFGRFNGGVVNVTTRAGSNTLSGTLFGFLRHEAFNARNYFAASTATKPLFRRRQAGGVVGAPLIRGRTFVFADYQGQRQNISRSVISTVPTVLQRQGVFTEAIGGRVPAIYDPATKAPFPNGAIPAARFDSVAASLLARYPLPTSSATANNFRRAGLEVNDQDQFDLRIDQMLGNGGDNVFARFTSFADRFEPVAPLPDGSGIASGTPGPQDTRVRAIASSYRKVMSAAWYNELRIGETTRSIQRRAARLGASILPTYAIAGYQQLGSPPNTETDFATGVRQVADTLTWVAERHTIRAGFDFRWSRLNVVQPPSPAGLYQFSTLFTDLSGVANTGNAFASFLLGQVQNFSIDVQAEQIRNRAHVQEYFLQDVWRVSDRLTVNAGLRYTLNFPSYEETNQSAVFNLDTQRLEYLGQDGHPRTARRLHTNNVGPRLGVVRRVTDRAALRVGYGLVWIEQPGITTPFTTPSFPFIQAVSQRTLDNLAPAFVLARGASVAPISPTPAAGLGQGVFAVDRELGSGYVQQWNLSFQHELRRRTSLEIAYVGSKITHVGIPDTNLNQLTVEQLALGSALLQRVPNPYFGMIPASSTLGEPTITVAQLLKPYPQYTAVSLYRNNVGNTHFHGVTAKLEQRSSQGLSYSVAYTRSKLIDDA